MTLTPGRARALLVFAMGLWGLQFVANHELLEVIDGLHIIVVRFGGVAVVLVLALVAFPDLRPRLTRQDVWLFVLAGALAVPGAQLMLVEGQNYLAPAMAGLVVATGPAITAVLAAVFLRERLTRRKMTGTAIALVGAAIVVVFASGTGTELTVRNPWGAALVLGAQVSFAGYTVITKGFTARFNPLSLVITGLLFGAVWLLPFVPATIAAAGDVQGLRWLWFLQLVVGGTLIPYVVWNVSLTVLPANETASYMFLVPLFGVMWSWLILREDLSLVGLAGGALVITGVVLTQVTRDSRALAPVPVEP